MKKIIGIAIMIAGLSLGNNANAQEDTTKKNNGEQTESSVKKGTKKAWKGTKKTAKTVGNETAELATKGKATATDKKSGEWIGPEGQVIYVDDGSKYYWINEKGGRVFVTKDKLKPKKQ